MAITDRTGGRAACAGIFLILASPLPALGQQTSVARIGGQTITAQELDARASAGLESQQRDYESSLRDLKLNFERNRQKYREHELGTLVDERALSLEAKARNTNPDALLAALQVAPVSEVQVRELYDSQKEQLNQPYPQIAPKIRDYLEKKTATAVRREYLDSLRTKFQAAMILEPLREPVEASGPMRGAKSAAVTIVEFSDYQCPYCGRFEPVVRRVLEKYPTRVRLIYRNLPLSSLHPDAEKAAEAAVCAQNQRKFWEMHDLLFAEQTALGVDALKEKAQRIGLDTAAFNACLDSGSARQAIEVDAQAAAQLAISSTPTSLINGRFTSGAITEAELTALIEDELHRVERVARR
jgi:protein-disulfide isomerase